MKFMLLWQLWLWWCPQWHLKKYVMYHTCISYADNQKNGTDEAKPKPAKEVEDSGSPTISLMYWAGPPQHQPNAHVKPVVDVLVPVRFPMDQKGLDLSFMAILSRSHWFARLPMTWALKRSRCMRCPVVSSRRPENNDRKKLSELISNGWRLGRNDISWYLHQNSRLGCKVHPCQERYVDTKKRRYFTSLLFHD